VKALPWCIRSRAFPVLCTSTTQRRTSIACDVDKRAKYSCSNRCRAFCDVAYFISSQCRKNGFSNSEVNIKYSLYLRAVLSLRCSKYLSAIAEENSRLLNRIPIPRRVESRLDVLLFTREPNALEVLEWLRNSYRRISERDALTKADQAVLVTVEITLKHVANAGWSQAGRSIFSSVQPMRTTNLQSLHTLSDEQHW
jgi:hypothetical protein